MDTCMYVRVRKKKSSLTEVPVTELGCFAIAPHLLPLGHPS